LETPEECVIREIAEESSLSIKTLDYVVYYKLSQKCHPERSEGSLTPKVRDSSVA